VRGMDLSRPAGVALPPGTEAVLRALAGTDSGLGVREVARIAGVSPNRASQVLSELAGHGVVLTRQQGSGRLCRLNRAHLATDALLALVGLRSRLLEFLREEVAAWERRPVHVSLFGSAARGDGGPGSDLDLLVVRPSGSRASDDDAWDTQLFDGGERIVAATGNEASWFVVTPDDLERAVRADEPVVNEWRRDGIHLAGQRLGTLLRRIA
jgi:predicted nucleotidyltransferase